MLSQFWRGKLPWLNLKLVNNFCQDDAKRDYCKICFYVFHKDFHEKSL